MSLSKERLFKKKFYWKLKLMTISPQSSREKEGGNGNSVCWCVSLSVSNSLRS